MDPARIADRLERARGEIAAACSRAGRDPESVRIVAITKGHPAATLRAALEAGVEDIGENRVQEALVKFGDAHEALEARRPRRHLVGHLQRNKARDALALFDWIQSIDSPRIAAAVSARAGEGDGPARVLVEVNAAEEPRRHGFRPDEVVERALEILELPGLEVRGLMAMAPFTEEEAPIRAAFATVRERFEQIRRQGAPDSFDTLSMGMSNDFPLAVEEGATMVRLGTALFGPRKNP